jgi:peptide/nickel transport system substrate-binding protein
MLTIPPSRPTAKWPRRAARPLVVLAGVLALLVSGCRRDRPAPTLVVGFGDRPTTLDPHLHNNNLTWSVLSSFYDGLVAFSPGMELEPALAVSWEHPDPRTWRFHLRHGVRFDNGDGFDAADVIASLERIRTRPDAAIGFHLAAIDSVSAEDPYTLILTTTRPLPDLLNRLVFAPIIPRRFAGLTQILSPIGTGPYSFAGLTADGAVLAKARASWRPTAEIADVRFQFYPNPDAATDDLLAGHVDVCHLLPPSRVRQVEQATSVRVVVQPRIGVQVLAIYPANAAVPARAALADRRVRRALLLGLNRAGWVDTVFRGNATVASQLVHPVVFGYELDLKPVPYDPEQARRLLTEAGVGRGFTVVLGHPASQSEVARAIAGDLKLIGIEVVLREGPAAAMAGLVQGGAISLQLFNWACSTGDATDVFDQLVLPPASMGIRTIRYWGFENAVVDRALTEAGEALQPERRLALLQTAQRALLDDLPLIPLVVPWGHIGVSQRVEVKPRFDEREWVASYRWRR